ncbi:MAG: molecular chaperone HtpG [Fibrobacteres bacterium]|nr:molecular chaperone HtpG [Fibrobacterota bacterium]
MAKETVEFKTEVKQLLDLVIHSLYSNKEIFLRELVSNASDAVDRARFESLTNSEILEGDSDWKIKISKDEKAGTITISDNGIGLDKETAVENLGTIARSGTKAFLEQLKAAGSTNNPEMIGQFGVGFYSSFMVADKVTVVSRKAKSQAIRWESTGDGSYTIEESTREKRGTDVTLHLKEDAKEYLNEWSLRGLVKKFSDYVEHPVVMDTEKEKGKIEEEVLNARKAIWLKNKSEVTEEEHNEFYKHIARDFTNPLKAIHFSAEGASEFKALVYIPSKAPFNMFDQDHKIGVHLYVKRIFIMDDCKKLLPDYLRFVKGVVDSSDLPLNVSREILQDTKEMEKIKKSLVNKVLSTLAEMKEKETDKYKQFFAEFGKILKEGVHFDYENKEKLLDLLMFESTHTDKDAMTSLSGYVDRMREEQKEIYYLTGESISELRTSPYLERFKTKSMEVLFMTDAVDEWILPDINEYKGKKLKAANRGDLAIDDESEKKAHAQKEKVFKELLTALQEKLPDVKEVKVSSRLTDSACCLVGDEHAPGAHMEKIYKAMGQDVPVQKSILEINPDHPLIVNLQIIHSKKGNEQKFADYAATLYDQALLLEGKKLKDPVGFIKRLNELLTSDSKSLL